MKNNSNETWIKLYRKLRGHKIMSDPTALQIFIWILISVDYKTGKMTTGRFWASEELKIKPRTFHKAVTERLRDRYKLVTLSSDNKNTIISVNKWDTYQSNSDTSSDTSVTPKGQQSDTKQEYKNKKNIRKRESGIHSLTDEYCLRLAKNYSLPVKAVISKKNDLILYCKANGKKYKDYKAALQSWVRKDLLK